MSCMPARWAATRAEAADSPEGSSATGVGESALVGASVGSVEASATALASRLRKSSGRTRIEAKRATAALLRGRLPSHGQGGFAPDSSSAGSLRYSSNPNVPSSRTKTSTQLSPHGLWSKVLTLLSIGDVCMTNTNLPDITTQRRSAISGRGYPSFHPGSSDLNDRFR